jgi:hypothetical protein
MVDLAGFACVAGIHIASLAGITKPFENWIPALFSILAIVFAATFLTVNRLPPCFKQEDIWRAALRRWPAWMRRAVWIVVGYGLLGFFLLPRLFGGETDSTASMLRSLSAFFLGISVAAVAVLFLVLRSDHFG